MSKTENVKVEMKEVEVNDLQRLLQDSALLEKALRKAHASGAFPEMEDVVKIYQSLANLGGFNNKYTIKSE